jgi:ribose transport system ATP-binding protein
VIDVRGLEKSFPGVRALHQVGLRLERGEVLAVVGENGAGKSTLMKILAGVQQPDSGEIRVDGSLVKIPSVRHATALGIALIHQELNLCDNLSVCANIFLGMEPRSAIRIDEKQIRTRSEEILARIGLDVAPDRLVGTLSIGQQQMVEIAKALAAQASVLIMDEPTSSLSQTESDRLFTVIDDLRRRGVGIIYISHRLGEVERLADRVMVLRDGENVGELSAQEIGHDAMVRLMVGRDVKQLYKHQPLPPGHVVLDVQGLRTSAYPEHALTLSVRAGEVVGLAGLVGAGRSELLRTLFGVDPWVGGRIELSGKSLSNHGPAAAIAAGMMLAPEDRKNSGLVIEQSVLDNLRLARLHRDRGRLGFVRKRDFDAEAKTLVERLDIRTPGLRQEVRLLSGGNQQKVVLGKWLSMDPHLLLLDEPTRGIDVGSKAEIYQLMDQLAAEGVAVLFASSEMEEVLGMADRVLVVHEGKITGELARDQFSEEAVMLLATGRGEVA